MFSTIDKAFRGLESIQPIDSTVAPNLKKDIQDAQNKAKEWFNAVEPQLKQAASEALVAIHTWNDFYIQSLNLDASEIKVFIPQQIQLAQTVRKTFLACNPPVQSLTKEMADSSQDLNADSLAISASLKGDQKELQALENQIAQLRKRINHLRSEEKKWYNWLNPVKIVKMLIEAIKDLIEVNEAKKHLIPKIDGEEKKIAQLQLILGVAENAMNSAGTIMGSLVAVDTSLDNVESNLNDVAQDLDTAPLPFIKNMLTTVNKEYVQNQNIIQELQS